MSTTAQLGALVSGLVWLGVLLLLVLAWVEDRHRENEELYANSRPARLGRTGYAPVRPPEPATPPLEAFAPPPEPQWVPEQVPAPAPHPELVPDPAPDAEPEARIDPFPATPQSGPPSLWQIHKPLSQPRTEPDPPNGADAARPAAAGDGS